MDFPSTIRPSRTTLYFIPVQTRIPLKFGLETLESVTCARVKMEVVSSEGKTVSGWGETPLSVQWVWPSALSYAERYDHLIEFTMRLAEAWVNFNTAGDPLQVGHAFQKENLRDILEKFNTHERAGSEPIPWLAALVCCSPFDIALHDAFGNLLEKPIYDTYTAEYLNADLSEYMTSEKDGASFDGLYPSDFLVSPRPDSLPAWHLVGGLDPIDKSELTGDEPNDDYPNLLDDWITTDGLTCLKIKLRGNDVEWDWERIIRVGTMGLALGVRFLSTDFNCTVQDPAYVNEILDRLSESHPAIFHAIRYVEQPFPYDLEANQLDVHSVSARKPLFMDESAHDWEIIRLGRSLGWTGVALKTCKTQTGAILSLCWAKAHGMELMVQDLTNPMIAQIPHVLLAAHAGTIQGVETNAMQFYPEASISESLIHPGLYSRHKGQVDLCSIQGSGFGYRIEEIARELPIPAIDCIRE